MLNNSAKFKNINELYLSLPGVHDRFQKSIILLGLLSWTHTHKKYFIMVVVTSVIILLEWPNILCYYITCEYSWNSSSLVLLFCRKKEEILQCKHTNTLRGFVWEGACNLRSTCIKTFPQSQFPRANINLTFT